MIILASSNKGKIKELKKMFNQDIIAYEEILGKFEIEETGNSFKQNAIIKSETVFEKLENLKDDKDYIVISDDSGISVPALDNEPGIYSARYSGENATDKDNLNKLINNLKINSIKQTYAYYTASIAITSKYGTSTVHGWMRGEVIDEMRGDGGFGYDPMFMPYIDGKLSHLTLGELDESIKKDISHRSKALKLARYFLT
jgi:XTP/dITP diphosphohydrolase